METVSCFLLFINVMTVILQKETDVTVNVKLSKATSVSGNRTPLRISAIKSGI